MINATTNMTSTVEPRSSLDEFPYNKYWVANLNLSDVGISWLNLARAEVHTSHSPHVFRSLNIFMSRRISGDMEGRQG